MIRKILILIILLNASVLSIFGQQDITFSQYTFDKLLINPAYAGSSQWLVGSLKNRTQFSKIEGVPQSNILTFQTPIQSKNIGLGVKVVQDKIAVTNRFLSSFLFSYHIGFGKGKLSFGLEGGIINYNYNYDNLNRIIIDDPSIPLGTQSVITPDFSTGIFYNHQNFYIGGSVNHLVDIKELIPYFSSNQYFTQSMSYYATGGYYIEVSRDAILEPGFLVKYMNGVPIQADVNLMFTLIDKFTSGVSYRTGDAIMILLKLDITKNLKIQYSFDYTLSKFSTYFSGNHEFSISYGIELLPPPAKKVIHPRYYF